MIRIFYVIYGAAVLLGWGIAQYQGWSLATIKNEV